MYTKFENLGEDKRQRIIGAAINEFAAKGFDDASTNQIVEDAGISKGLLFHYFKSKKQLFLYMYDYCIRLFTDEFFVKVDLTERDLFEKLHKIMIIKLELVRKYGGFMDFLKAAYLEESKEVKQELDSRNRNALNSSIARVFEDIDTTRFKQGIDAGQVIKTVVWAYEGFSNDFLRRNKNAHFTDSDYIGMFAEAEKYTGFLKSCFYQQQYEEGLHDERC